MHVFYFKCSAHLANCPPPSGHNETPGQREDLFRSDATPTYHFQEASRGRGIDPSLGAVHVVTCGSLKMTSHVRLSPGGSHELVIVLSASTGFVARTKPLQIFTTATFTEVHGQVM